MCRTDSNDDLTQSASLALGSLLSGDSHASEEWIPPSGRPHLAPKAKSVIWLFMRGGVSHMESFDPKPKLTELQGKTIGETEYASVQDPERLKKPIRKRPDGSWEEIDWEEAFELAATRLAAIKDAHGANSNGYYIGNPTGHNVGGQLYLVPLMNALETQRSFSAATMDQHPQNVALHTMIGDPWFFPIPDIERTDFFVCMGGNPLVSQGSLMSGPNAKKRLQEVIARGPGGKGRVVVIDPRHTDTAKRTGAQWIPIRPGTDGALALSMIDVMIEEELYDDKDGTLDDQDETLDDQDETLAGLDEELDEELGQAAPAAGRRIPKWAVIAACGLVVVAGVGFLLMQVLADDPVQIEVPGPAGAPATTPATTPATSGR